MTIDGSHLLRNLEPAIRPGQSVPSATSSPRAAFENQSFDQLLRLVGGGGVRSERPIELAFSAQPPLSSEQLSKLSDAADQAEASGFQKAMILIDGRALILDVASRTLTAELVPGSDTSAHGIDGAVLAHSDAAPHSSILKPPSAGILSSQLFNQLRGNQPNQHQAAFG